jgi:hypothetical protein
MPHESSLWGVGLGLALVFSVASLIMSPFGLSAWVWEGNQERFMETVKTHFTQPPVLADTKVNIDYYYRKVDKRVRAVIWLPDGHDSSITASGSFVEADKAMPKWACHLNPESDDTYASLNVLFSGEFMQRYGANDAEADTILNLDNNKDNQGTLLLKDNDDGINGFYLYLGNTWCENYVGDKCLTKYIADVEFHLDAAVDTDAWDTEYDKKGR